MAATLCSVDRTRCLSCPGLAVHGLVTSPLVLAPLRYVAHVMRVLWCTDALSHLTIATSLPGSLAPRIAAQRTSAHRHISAVATHRSPRATYRIMRLICASKRSVTAARWRCSSAVRLPRCRTRSVSICSCFPPRPSSIARGTDASQDGVRVQCTPFSALRL